MKSAATGNASVLDVHPAPPAERMKASVPADFAQSHPGAKYTIVHIRNGYVGSEGPLRGRWTGIAAFIFTQPRAYTSFTHDIRKQDTFDENVSC